MRALVVFHDGVRHPLGMLMKTGFSHCFVCIEENGLWIQVDGRDGVPLVHYLAQSDGFDLASFYRDKGFTVVETEQGSSAVLSPLVLRNCVGLVKAVLCIRSFAVTPWQLYRHLRRKQK